MVLSINPDRVDDLSLWMRHQRTISKKCLQNAQLVGGTRTEIIHSIISFAVRNPTNYRTEKMVEIQFAIHSAKNHLPDQIVCNFSNLKELLHEKLHAKYKIYANFHAWTTFAAHVFDYGLKLPARLMIRRPNTLPERRIQ